MFMKNPSLIRITPMKIFCFSFLCFFYNSLVISQWKHVDAFLGLPNPVYDVVDAIQTGSVGYRLSQSVPAILSNIGHVAGQGLVVAAGGTVRVAENALRAVSSPTVGDSLRQNLFVAKHDEDHHAS